MRRAVSSIAPGMPVCFLCLKCKLLLNNGFKLHLNNGFYSHIEPHRPHHFARNTDSENDFCLM